MAEEKELGIYKPRNDSWKTNTDLCRETLSEAEGAETRIAQPRHQNSVSLDLSIEISALFGDPTTPEDVTDRRIQEVTDDIDLSLEDTDQTVNELNGLPNICKQA